MSIYFNQPKKIANVMNGNARFTHKLDEYGILLLEFFWLIRRQQSTSINKNNGNNNNR